MRSPLRPIDIRGFVPIAVVAMVVVGLFRPVVPVKGAPPKPVPRVGINLAGPSDFSSELPFVDVFRQARPWISQQKGKPWGQGPKLDLDANGWVKKLEPGCWAESPLCTLDGGTYPSGKYTVLYEGSGKIEFFNAATILSAEPGRITINVDSKKGGFFLKLMASDPKNYIRNIRVIMPGYEKTYREEPWNPAFLKLWRGMACIRFMDYMDTNNSAVSRWSERPTVADATFSFRGVPLELMIDLANRLKTDVWFCMPHRADDDYVRRFAALTREKLDPKLRVYVEYSNEMWNAIFGQNKYAAEQGRKLGFSDKPWEAGWRYTAHRSLEIFSIWEKEFGRQRLVRVLPTQAANPAVTEEITRFEDAGKHADALAIAPYLSLNIGPQTKPNSTEVASWTVDRVLDYAEQHSLPESVGWIKQSKKLADQFGLKLIAYEGGQHFVGIQGGENNEALTKLLHEANANPRLAKIYKAYFDAWEREGGDLFVYFSSVSYWSKWGSWGLLQYMNDDPSKAPKFQAVMNWAKSLGQPVTVPK